MHLIGDLLRNSQCIPYQQGREQESKQADGAGEVAESCILVDRQRNRERGKEGGREGGSEGGRNRQTD